MSEAYRGVIHGGTVVLLENNMRLTEGTEVVVTPLSATPGTPVAVLAAVENAPRVPADWVDELERLIASGKRPPTQQDPFSKIP